MKLPHNSSKMLRSFFIFLVLFEVCYAKRDYAVKLTKFEANPETDSAWGDKGTLRITQKSRNLYVASGSWSLFKNLGNEIIAGLTIYQISVTGNLIPEYKMEGKLCDYLKNEKMYQGLVEKSNMPSGDTCPFPKGNYTVTDYIIDEELLPETLPNGDFTGTAMIRSMNKMVLGFDFDFTVEKA